MTRWVHRLWLRIWLATIGAIVVVAVLAVAAWRALFDPTPLGSGAATLASALAAELPEPGAAAALAQEALESARARSDADFALYDAGGRLIARAGRPLPPPQLDEEDSHWVGWHMRGPEGLDAGERQRMPAYALKLADGRWLVVRRSARSLRRPVGPWPTLALLALAVAAGTYPIVRRLTRRLERLQSSVERLGGGDLTARVPVEGNDEVARLAVSFNEAAARIEQLVQAHRGLLANASHELRSPLARMEAALGLARQSPERVEASLERIERESRRLDALVGEVLTLARLDSGVDDEAPQTTDLAALLASVVDDARFEGERIGVTVSSEAPARLPMRARADDLLRAFDNIVRNALRFAPRGSTIEIALKTSGDGRRAILTVDDKGPGLRPDELDSVFRPFVRANGGSNGAGFGLGLAIAERAVRAHDGTIEASNRPGGGLRIAITLPLTA